MPLHPRQALSRLGARGPEGPAARAGAGDPRRDRAAGHRAGRRAKRPTSGRFVGESGAMKVCSYATASGQPGLGIVEGDEVIDLSAADVPSEPAVALAEVGRDGLENLANDAPRLPLADVELLAPAAP